MTELALPRAARPLLDFIPPAAPQWLCGRAGTEPGFSARDRAARPARYRGHPPCRASPRWRRRSSGSPISTCCSICIFSALAGALSDQVDRERRGPARSRTMAPAMMRRCRTTINETGHAATAREALSRARSCGRTTTASNWHGFSRHLPDTAAAPPRLSDAFWVSAAPASICNARCVIPFAPMANSSCCAAAERQLRPRAVLLLIDVSGSMKARSDAHLALRMRWSTRRRARGVHVRHAADPADPGAAAEGPRQALAVPRASSPTGTAARGSARRWGALLAVPRFAGLRAGRWPWWCPTGWSGAPARMSRAVGHLAARAWQIVWLTPLAAATAFGPETAALRAILPMLDSAADGATGGAALREFLDLSRRRTIR